MGIYNPLYNEETGWAALDQLTPQQQAFMNPQANMSGYGMGVNPASMYQFTQFGGSPGQLPAGVDPYAVSNGISGFPGFQTGSNLLGGGNPQMLNTNDPSTLFNNANRTAQSAQLPGSTPASAGGNNTVIGSPSMPQYATNMGMQGAENVGGVGMYTGSNGPLNMSLFAPQGADAAIASGSMGGLGQMMFQAAQQNGMNPNVSYLQFIDDLSRRALASKGGGGGLLPQDFVNYLQSQGGQQWISGMRTPQQPQTQTQPQIQQTGPTNPPVAPQNFNQQYPGGVQPQQNQNDTRPEMPQWLRDTVAQGKQIGFDPPQFRGGPQPQQNISGVPREFNGANQNNPMSQLQNDPQFQQYGQALSNAYRMVGFQSDPMGMQSVISPEQQQMVDRIMQQQYPQAYAYGNRLMQQYSQPMQGQNPFGNQSSIIGSPSLMIDPARGQFGGNQYSGTQRQFPQYSSPDGMNFLNGGIDSGDLRSRAAQFSDDPRTQQAYINEMYASQMPQYQQPYSAQQPDFRAATFGGQSLFPQQTQQNQNTSYPGGINTTNPTNSQMPTTAGNNNPWGNAQRRSSFGSGGMSLFGGMASQQSSGTQGFTGQRVGRPASYGTQYKPY